jgi:hypothetical protein
MGRLASPCREHVRAIVRLEGYWADTTGAPLDRPFPREAMKELARPIARLLVLEEPLESNRGTRER